MVQRLSQQSRFSYCVICQPFYFDDHQYDRCRQFKVLYATLTVVIHNASEHCTVTRMAPDTPYKPLSIIQGRRSINIFANPNQSTNFHRNQDQLPKLRTGITRQLSRQYLDKGNFKLAQFSRNLQICEDWSNCSVTWTIFNLSYKFKN